MSQTVRIYCGGQPSTARLVAQEDLSKLEELGVRYVCDRCGNRIRRVVVWGERAHLPKIRRIRG